MPQNQNHCIDPQFYSFLAVFSNDNTPCKSYLIKKFGTEKYTEAIEKGYIEEVGKTDIGDIQYGITEKGRKIYD